MLQISIHNQTDYLPNVSRLQAAVTAACAVASQELRRVEISFVEESVMAAINRRYRGQAQSTDVLSWPFDQTFPQGRGGELLVAPAVAIRNARALEIPVADEITTLVIHGTLHLLGYTDDTAAGRVVMDRLTGLAQRRLPQEVS